MIDASFFTQNRARLRAHCKGIIALSAYEAMQLSGDMAAPFRQEANFWYLTGLEEPGWRLILSPDRSWLVMPNMSEASRIFNGGVSVEEAQGTSGVDEVISSSEESELLVRLAKKHDSVYGLGRHPHQKYYDFVINPGPDRLWRQLKKHFPQVHDIRSEMARLRAIKQQVEIDAIMRSIDITVKAFADSKDQLASFDSENQVEAEFTHAFRRQGASHAYDPIVASGAHACTLHYATNNDSLDAKDLLLIDIGARVGGYPADITRTYAVGENPSSRQRAVHTAVKGAHRQIIQLLRPGLTFSEYQGAVDVLMKEALRVLDFPDDDVTYRRYFPHAISHGLGVDVHDSLGGFGEFRPGMILTVEPGIYIPEESIGVRLEDDILITEVGHCNLSKTLSLDL